MTKTHTSGDSILGRFNELFSNLQQHSDSMPFADSWLPDLLLIAGSPELKAFFKPIIVGLSALRPAEGRMPPLMEKKQDER